jgi:uncharacterized membrane protein YesL
MNQLFDQSSPLVRSVMWIGNVLLLNFLWLVTSIPVFTIGASTTAMYSTVYNSMRFHRDDVFHGFFGAFKKNFKQATLPWLCFLALAVIFSFDISILKGIANNGYTWGNLYVLLYVVLVAEMVYWFYTVAYCARFKNTVKACLLNSFIILYRHFLTTIVILLVITAAVVLVYIIPYTIFAVPLLMIYSITYFIERAFRKEMTDEQRESEKAREREAIQIWNQQYKP